MLFNKYIVCSIVGQDPFNHRVLEMMFTGSRTGRLIGPKAGPTTKTNTEGDCARACADLPMTKCLSFNYDFGDTTCELIEAIENEQHKLSISKVFEHYERISGKTKQFTFSYLSLKHNSLNYFNFWMKNNLNYKNIISTKGILIDVTIPEPGI
jgi:hypothetical protein